MATKPWYSYPITEAHSQDDGVDIGTPNDTPVNLPFSGTVIHTEYQQAGGLVVVAIPGTNYSQYALHLNKIYVADGDTIDPGTIIGTSGGGVGDLLLHNGTVQPARYQSWYGETSTGYHMEYGIFQGQTWQEFARGFGGNRSRQLDPTPIIISLAQNNPSFYNNALTQGLQPLQNLGNASMSVTHGLLGILPDKFPNPISGLNPGNVLNPSGIISGINSQIITPLTADFITGLKRSAIFIFGLIMCGIGIYLIFKEPIDRARDYLIAQGVSAAKDSVSLGI